jgi:hypothetical protein
VFQLVLVLFQILDDFLDFLILLLECLHSLLDKRSYLHHLFSVVCEVDSELSLVLEAECLDLVASMLLYLLHSVLESVCFLKDIWKFVVDQLNYSLDEVLESLDVVDGFLENISVEVVKFDLDEGRI